MLATAEDHVLHDLARIRLVDAPTEASRRVSRMFGTTPVSTSGTADITIRYVESCTADSTLRWIGRNRSAFDDETFYAVERSAQGGPGLSALPLDLLGKGDIEIRCDRSVAAPPGLIEMFNLTMLAKGILPLHGSAFCWRGTGVVAAGWSKGGKTETLLAFAGDGAEVIADEWTYVMPDRRMCGLAEPIRLEAAHVAHLEHVGTDRSIIGRGQRARAATARFAIASHRTLFAGRRVPGARLARALVSVAEARDAVTVSPRDLFERQYVAAGHLDRLVFLVTARVSSPIVRATTPAAVAARMTHAHVHHRRDLIARYHEFRYAFPERRCELLDGIEAVETELLERVLDGVPCVEVLLPQPPAIDDLHRALAPVLSERP